MSLSFHTLSSLKEQSTHTFLNCVCIFCIYRLSWIVIMHVASVKCNLPINIWIWLRLSFALCTGEFIGLSREYFERRIQDKFMPVELTRRPCFLPARVCDWLMLNFLERFRLRLLEGACNVWKNTKYGKLSTKLPGKNAAEYILHGNEYTYW